MGQGSQSVKLILMLNQIKLAYVTAIWRQLVRLRSRAEVRGEILETAGISLGFLTSNKIRISRREQSHFQGERMGEATGVLVIGAGPAGLAAAIAARMKGFDVTVADGAKPPIDKACGEGLMPSTMAALCQLGVAICPDDGRIFRGVRFVDGVASVEADFSRAPGFGMRRTVLHQKMVERAQECGVTLLWNTPGIGVCPD